MDWICFWGLCLLGNLVMWWSVGHWFNIFASGIALSSLGDALIRLTQSPSTPPRDGVD